MNNQAKFQAAWTKFQDAFLETMEKCIPKGKIKVVNKLREAKNAFFSSQSQA